MTAVWRSSSAGMLVPVTEHISAATLPVACVDLVPPVPGRAGKLRSLTDDAGSRKRARRARKWSVCPGGRSQAVRLVRRSRRQKAAGRHDNWLQLALTMHPESWFQLANIDRAFHYGTGYTFATAHRSTSSC